MTVDSHFCKDAAMSTDSGQYVPEIRPVGRSEFIVTHQNGDTQRVKLRGHRLYVRKDERAEKQGGIFLPEQAGHSISVSGSDDTDEIYFTTNPRDNVDTATVLCIGDEVGKKRNPKRFPEDDGRKVARRDGSEIIRLGDRIVCEREHPWGISRSNFYDYDYFVDTDAVAIVIQEDDA